MIVASPKYNVQETSVSIYETRMTLTIRKFQKEDIGSYRCIAKNSLGEVDSSIRLYEIPDAKGTTHNHNHYNNHAHGAKHNTNDVSKTQKQQQQQQQQQLQSQTNQRNPKVIIESDDDDIVGSAEDYDDADLSPNIFLKPTKMASDIGGGAGIVGGSYSSTNHHFPYKPLFGNSGIGTNGAGNNMASGINGNSINGNNGIVTRTEVRSYDNEVSTATASTIMNTVFNVDDISKLFKKHFIHLPINTFNYFILFIFNSIISISMRFLVT